MVFQDDVEVNIKSDHFEGGDYVDEHVKSGIFVNYGRECCKFHDNTTLVISTTSLVAIYGALT